MDKDNSQIKDIEGKRPIPFSSEMVRAILDGQKIQTRRIIKAPEWWEGHFNYSKNNTQLISRDGGKIYYCPYGNPGDKLWVREKFYLTCAIGKPYIIISYGLGENKITNANNVRKTKLKFHKDYPSIFMPRWASRITLEIKNIKVERIQEITIKDAIKEGVDCNFLAGTVPINTFIHLWNSINAKRGYGWDENPWVWVVEFVVV